jgi:rhodanese-related sulfurtransferase
MNANPSRPRLNRVLAGAAAVLAFATLAAGDAGARVDLDALARTVEAEEDRVTALELAAWIRDRKPDLRVVDVRDSASFAAFHIPNAENLPVTALTRAGFGADETVVLYSEGGTHAAQGWFFLRAAGVEKVYFLRGGLYEWMTEVMSPTLPAGATPAQRAEFARTSEISRYFGGMPRVGATSASESESESGPTSESGSIATSRSISESASGSEDGDPAAEFPARRAEDDGGAAAAEVARLRRQGC